jgi:hypothetical protein
MKKIFKLGSILLLAAVSLVAITGCSDAEVASYNVSKDADNFKVYRHIVFVNNITGEYLLEMTGYCNIEADTEDKQLEVVCRDNKGGYIKNFLGVNDTTTYFVEQIESSRVSDDHYTVIIKPKTLIPFVEVR